MSPLDGAEIQPPPPPPPPIEEQRHLFETIGISTLHISLNHGRRNFKDTNPQISSLLVFNRVHELKVQPVMLIFSTQLCAELLSL
jgi:hypothetical protein